MIQDTIEKLKILQDILSQKYTLEQEIEELPRTLATKKELVSRLKKSFLEKNEKFEEARRRVADLRVRLQEAESDREKYESQMDQITTAREYDALEKEIRDASEREQQHRRDLQREEKELEEQRVRLEREEAMIKTEEEELEQERAKIDSETAERKATLKELAKSETETVPGLDEDLLFKFERIIKSKEGEGIVAIRNGVCTGCQMILPNQFVNDVRKGDHILFCPYCSKIVFFTEDDADLEDSGFSASDEESLADLIDDDFDEDLFDEEEMTDLTDEDELTPEEEAEYDDDDTVDDDEAGDDDVEDDEEDGVLEDEDDSLLDDDEAEEDFEEDEELDE
jgi:uncharacterized protein